LTLLALFAVRPYVYEAYVIPTDPMAPTLLGDHLTAACPRCGAPAYGLPPQTRWGPPPDGVQMICSKELRSVFVKPVPQARGGGDQILTSKLLKPRRWDLLVFRYPGDPSVNYAMRLVGLPGERLAIREGAVWINGAKVDPPASIRGIQYSATVTSHGRDISGPGSLPLTLGADEYYVLGDFVDESFDSRLWEKGAPGHPPYAVPESYIVGVVINIYWPPSRWKSFR
jgi:signal peptidase I